MRNFTFLMLLTLVAFRGTAQKSALMPTTFSAEDKMLIASVLDIENGNVLEDKANAVRINNTTVNRDSTYYDVSNCQLLFLTVKKGGIAFNSKP